MEPSGCIITGAVSDVGYVGAGLLLEVMFENRVRGNYTLRVSALRAELPTDSAICK